MDEKTEELRDIFMDVTDEETVTESQAETRGSLVDDEDAEEKLRDVVASMRESLEFETDLDLDTLVRVVQGYYDEESDEEIAQALDGVSPATVVQARMDLHLVSDDESDTALATADREAVVREIRRVNRRYRDEFETILQDRDLAERLTDVAQRDGLEGATADQETDTQM
ncbi:MAG: conditioned medium-induced protein 4 [Halanaeroarchaeum sp.]